MKNFIIVLGLTVVMTASLKLSSSRKESIEPSSKMYNNSVNTKSITSGDKTTPYNYRYVGSGVLFMMEVKMPINEMLRPTKEGC